MKGEPVSSLTPRRVPGHVPGSQLQLARGPPLLLLLFYVLTPDIPAHPREAYHVATRQFKLRESLKKEKNRRKFTKPNLRRAGIIEILIKLDLIPTQDYFSYWYVFPVFFTGLLKFTLDIVFVSTNKDKKFLCLL